jgi:predicted DNA binding CopG/RHH family protein
MKKKLPGFRSDKEAEEFVDKGDLTEYDLSEMRSARFEFQPKSERVNMRLPRQTLGCCAILRRQSRSSLPTLHSTGAGRSRRMEARLTR